MSQPKVHSGARAIIMINQQVMVYALNVQYDITTDHHVINSIDNPLPEELAPGNVDVNITCSMLRVPKESASVLAFQPTILNTLHQGYVSIEIRDRGTNDTILYIPKAMMRRRTGAVASRQLAAETWTFRGIGYWDERPPQAARPTGKSTGGDADSLVNRAIDQTLSGISNLSKKIRNPF